MHFRQIVSTSRGTPGWSCRTETGSCSRTCRRPADETFVQNGAECVHVRSRANAVPRARSLLWGHVARRAERPTGFGVAVIDVEELREAEVADLGRKIRCPECEFRIRLTLVF